VKLRADNSNGDSGFVPRTPSAAADDDRVTLSAAAQVAPEAIVIETAGWDKAVGRRRRAAS
jgi:hypothetical protein